MVKINFYNKFIAYRLILIKSLKKKRKYLVKIKFHILSSLTAYFIKKLNWFDCIELDYKEVAEDSPDYDYEDYDDRQ